MTMTDISAWAATNLMPIIVPLLAASIACLVAGIVIGRATASSADAPRIALLTFQVHRLKARAAEAEGKTAFVERRRERIRRDIRVGDAMQSAARRDFSSFRPPYAADAHPMEFPK